MTTETQTVAQDTNVQVTPDTAAAGAQTEEINLDALLSEWADDTGEENTNSAPANVEPKVNNTENQPDETKQIVDYVKQQMSRDQKAEDQRVTEEYKKTVVSLKGDLPVSDKFVDGFLRIRASEDPRILTAYQNRHKAPDKWAKIEKGIQNEIRSELKALPDKGATDTRTQIANALQNSQSNSTYEADKPLKDMNDAEFNEYHRKFISS